MTEAGRTSVYVQPFPPTATKYQLFANALDNPHHPLWSPNGKALFYTPRAGGFESVAVTTQPTFAFGNPVAVSRVFTLGPVTVRRPFDITPGGRFVGLMLAGQPDSGAGQGEL